MKRFTIAVAVALALVGAYIVPTENEAQAEIGTYAHGEKKILLVPITYEYLWEGGTEPVVRSEGFYENLCDFTGTYDSNPNNDWRPKLERFADSIGEITNGKITIPHENIHIIPQQAYITYDPSATPPRTNKVANSSDSEMRALMNSWQPILDPWVEWNGYNLEDYDHIMWVTGTIYGVFESGRLINGYGRNGMPDDPATYTVSGDCLNLGVLQNVILRNYGLKFASSIEPETKQPYTSGNWDHTDIMSKLKLGWLGDTNIANKLFLDVIDYTQQPYFETATEAAAAGAMTIFARDVFDPDQLTQQGIFIETNSANGETLAIDYRSPEGPASDYLADYYYDDFRDRLYIVKTNNLLVERTNGSTTSYIYDPQPTQLQEILNPGESYPFTANGTSGYINFIGKQGLTADVSVSSCKAAPPTVSVAPVSLTGEVGDTITFHVTVTNNNPKQNVGGCDRSDFALAIENLPSGFSYQPVVIENLRSNAGHTHYMDVTIVDNTATTSDLVFTATEVNSKFVGSANATLIVDVPQPDVLPPTIPQSLFPKEMKGKNRGNVELTWDASTDSGSGVSHYNVSCTIAGNDSTTETKYVLTSPVSGQSCNVNAEDFAGNISGWSNSVIIP